MNYSETTDHFKKFILVLNENSFKQVSRFDSESNPYTSLIFAGITNEIRLEIDYGVPLISIKNGNGEWIPISKTLKSLGIDVKNKDDYDDINRIVDNWMSLFPDL